MKDRTQDWEAAFCGRLTSWEAAMPATIAALAATLLCLLMSAAVAAGETNIVRAVALDAEKLAGIGLPAEEQFIAPDDVLEGSHRPRGEVLHYGEQLITEVYEDDEATFRFAEPSPYDEFVLILSGKLILTAADGVAQEFVAGDSLVVPKGFTGTWKMLGNYRELIVIERQAYEEAYGTGEE
jgi:uncharacterized cupin superfamily protein